jgi:pSer/pThr/pTyr-binding forkhead associated (FHA) protein
MESIGEIGDVISDIDVRISEQFDEAEAEPPQTQRNQDRVTRVLVGKVGDQLLRFPLFKDRLTIGRSDDNDIQLNATYISRRHAVVQTDGDTTRIIDWGSKNGVYVNSARVTEHFLQNGDIVSIGNAHFRYDERAKRDV